MGITRTSTQSGAAYSNQNLSGAQIAARMTGAQIRAQFADAGYLFVIHPNETAAGLVVGNLTLGFPLGDVRRYGAVDGAADVAPQVHTAAIANKRVVFPKGTWNIVATPAIPAGTFLDTEPGVILTGAGATAIGFLLSDGRQSLFLNESIAQAAGFYNSYKYAHSYGGATMTGGRNSLEVQSAFIAPSAVGNFNKNYVAGAFQCQSSSGDGGTNATSNATSAGAIFGLNAVGILNAGSNNMLNVTAAEFDVAAMATTSVWLRTGIQVSELANSAVRGAGFDAGILLSAQAPNVGFLNGFLVCDAGGAPPIATTGNILATQGVATVANGINFSSYTITGSAFLSKGFNILGSGFEMDLGVTNASGTYLLNFHTSGISPNYDSRIVATGGNGANGNGSLIFNSNAIGFFGAAVSGGQQVGYGTPTGGVRQASFAAGTITLAQLAAAVAQLILDLKQYNLIGA